MAVFISENEKRGTTTIRHNWRLEVFCEFGDPDPLVKAHRQEVVYDTDTMEALKVSKDRVVTRKFSDLPEQIQGMLTAIGAAFDTLESLDILNEGEKPQ
jgi:hypothetical protein